MIANEAENSGQGADLDGRQNGGRLRAGRWVTPACDSSNLTGRAGNCQENSPSADVLAEMHCFQHGRLAYTEDISRYRWFGCRDEEAFSYLQVDGNLQASTISRCMPGSLPSRIRVTFTARSFG